MPWLWPSTDDALVEQSARTAMLCSVAYIVPYIIFVTQLNQLASNFFKTEAALPPGAEDEIVLIEHLPGRQVHLQDFFWTGASDAPSWLDPDQTLNFYETRTVHHTATVYVSGAGEDARHQGQDRTGPLDPGCVNCIEPTATLAEPEQDIGILVGDDPGPRYWLLTVLRAGENVPPKVELKLARLYRAAFARQQQRHLGLLSTDPRLRRATKRIVSLDNPKSIAGERINTNINQDSFSGGTTIESESLVTELPEKVNKMREIKLPANKNNKYFRSNRAAIDKTIKSIKTLDDYSIIERDDKFEITTPISITSPEFRDNEMTHLQLENQSNQESTTTSTSVTNENVFEIKNLVDNSILSSTFASNKPGNPQLLRSNEAGNFETAIISNSAGNSSSDIEKLGKSLNENEENLPPRGGGGGQVNIPLFQANSSSGNYYKLRTSEVGVVQVRMQNTSVLIDGSTRLIYSVHLGGKPVPAETAAKDMALLSPQEVALELGAPVIIQSEPYLKETQPLALSRKRDALLLVGAAGVALLLLIVLAGIILVIKKKKSHSSVSAPPTHQGILKKDKNGYTPTSPVGFDNTGYTSETEGRTDCTSQRQTPGGLSRSPDTLITPNTLDEDIQDLSSDNENEQHEEQDEEDEEDEEDDDEEEGNNNLEKEEEKANEVKHKIEKTIRKKKDTRQRVNDSWNTEDYSLAEIKTRSGHRRIARTNAMEKLSSPDSIDPIIDHKNHNRNSRGNGYTLEETGSTHSYLSMPSCKLFPSMRSVEPLSKILEPVVVRHLDMEFETPEMSRRGNGFVHRENESLARTRSALRDPGVVGPIVWDLRRQRAVAESVESCHQELDVECQAPSSGPVGRARRRLHELLEDSFSLFGMKETTKTRENQVVVSSMLRPSSGAISPDRLTIFSESKGKSVQVSPVESPIDKAKNRQCTLLTQGNYDESIPETGMTGRQRHGAWSTRPLSAGPFHRPSLPEINVTRVLADTQLAPEDPAVPLIAAIRKELEKFTPVHKSN